ncbi:heme biosynthesis protein HemY [Mesorhizobium sp. M2D.F.Ca.ET.185.01.1.1]|uniref:heme biosynthesis protein HemY n=1 Tax=unclassified Mesorhizobium TaxID=325217 RepID=UPI000FCC41F4|nr:MULTISPECIES: heme biosynthesis protein HemY [unclassified Mesorhizobium]TGP48242.1 heme biosynthesis protein HemY [bacterium M00.F.Ca.ET.230.01.1.1]TGP75746.1 heme biosynthesis protein HemY [bacterium M00.F.Ca.ET.227.01.1.1]TGP87227.1 heme biosynthesis protein HemY [bacterium M00.F.Ca.ET.221.01.1.1]TGP91719.1 heme biosynthesis protein HemY [bacterium M00.F.Ca.ET.222.01.1.1]TGT69976.1 heme biosynthesis protein HemY [bacterium M00.F.Ca.ET.159.01.1.1]TGT81927.1 heme biosynthesis protein HemY
MIRLLAFLAVVFALGLGFAWLADRPGEMLVTFNGYQYQLTLMVAAVAIVAVVAAVMIVWWLIKSLWNSPYTISRYFRVRRRDRGYQALSTGMIAAGAGDGALARKKTKEAAKLISSDQEPLINLLDAQASLLEGDHEGAREKFERMLDDPEMRLLGLRGLYLEAERLGDRNAARHYAGRAAAVAPQLAWAAESTLEELTERGDWDGALKLVEAQKSTRQIERDAANRRRAVLLTAKAQALVDSDPNAARTAALEANKLAPDFAPAAVIAADLVIRQNDVRKGSKILEAAWKAEPHPDIAELYTHARSGDAVLDRLNRAKKLQELKRNHPESSMAVARAALDAQDYATARREAEAAIRMDRREGAYLLLADIEEAETGDQGKVRQLLSKAVRAPRDPAWVADGVISERWAPVSPVTGKLDAFTWRAPMERLGHLIESDADVAVPAVAAAPSAAPAEKAIDIVADAPAGKPASTNGGEKDRAAAQTVGEAETIDQGAGLPHLPDDPGVAPEEAQEKSPRRFRLF